MSFILDALQKSERERNAGQTPALDEALTRPLPAPTHRSRRDTETLLMLKTGLGVTAAFLLAGIAWWALSRPDAQAPSEDAVVAEAVPAPATEPPTEQPLAVPPPATAMRVDPERLRAPVAGPDLGPDAASLDELLDETPVEEPAPDELPPPPVDAPVTPAPAEPPPPPPPATSAAVRPLKDMPPSFRSEFPALAIQVHVYDSNPLRRFVLVNGKKYRETDTLVEGPRVVEIVPEGVVVEQRGTRVLVENPR